MKNALRLSTRQQLALTPQVQQTIRMLQLGAKELGEEIDEALNTNPLLSESRTYQHPTPQTEVSSPWTENQSIKQSITLEDHLIKQLSYLNLSSIAYVVACIVITCLGDDGYLRKTLTELEEVCGNENIIVTIDQLNEAINLIQQLEPTGVGCRDLGECFRLQIEQKGIAKDVRGIALRVCEQLDLLAQNKKELQNAIGVDHDDFQAALELIAGLDPAPGNSYDQQTTIYIQPDAFLTVYGDRFLIRLNPLINRSIELNQHYIDLLKQSGKHSDRAYLRNNLEQAKWWLNALIQRNNTLHDVVKYMAHHQVDYFKTGDLMNVKPLKQQQIADELQIHRSTVSRAIRNKHLQTPIGIVALKQLLAGSIRIDNENSLSNHAVKSIIKNLIKNESSQTPLSDSKIVTALETRGIVIARRTVNKYREQLNIPASKRRRVINK